MLVLLLITETAFARIWLQQTPKDTLKKVKIDTLNTDDEEPLQHQIIYNARDSIRYETIGNKIYLFGDAYVYRSIGNE